MLAFFPYTTLFRSQQAVLFTGAHAASGAFGPQSNAIPIAVFEGVHFFLDDVGNLADGTFEQIGGLHNRKTDFPIAVAPQYAGNDTLQVLPVWGLVRQDEIGRASCRERVEIVGVEG